MKWVESEVELRTDKEAELSLWAEGKKKANVYGQQNQGYKNHYSYFVYNPCMKMSHRMYDRSNRPLNQNDLLADIKSFNSRSLS